MKHTIECQARGTDYHNTCDACAVAGDTTAAIICTEEFSDGNGWQTVHYCQDCYDAIQSENGQEA
jgi:hypothetical protein